MKKLLLLIFVVLSGCTDSRIDEIDRDNENQQVEIVSYFEPLEITYDGPMLDEEFYNIDPIDPRGGLLEVELLKCVDGDTAKFDYPTEYEDTIKDYTSVRFLNMDTEEVYSGNEEEFGKPASVYTCNQLENASSILIQTDPGDNLFDKYDRLLGWVWVKPINSENYQLLNYMVTRQGLARVAYLYGAGETIYYSDKSYTDWMYQAENYSINDKIGLHGELLDPYWNYETNQPNY